MVTKKKKTNKDLEDPGFEDQEVSDLFPVPDYFQILLPTNLQISSGSITRYMRIIISVQ